MIKPRIDLSINLGGLLATISLLLTLLNISAKLEARLTALEVKIDPIWRSYWQATAK